jgi:predicted signal transduction protein with EAL and GGDEF domain
MGIAVFPNLASTLEQLFDRADYALYHAKRTRRGGAVLFDVEHEKQINIEARIEHLLKQANLEDELSVMFQPIVNIDYGQTVGFEALARWHSPVLGCVSPAKFFSIAERAGIVGSLTRPLLKKALVFASEWEKSLRLSFNLSAHDLNTCEGVLSLIGIIESSGFDPWRLDLEITETAFAHDFEQIKLSVEMLRRLGCGISLDDFGTGYSSLTRLHALPLTKIKIDRSFVTDLHKRPASLKIVKSLLTLSRDMGLECVVEGVETPEELAALRGLGGTLVQGYLYSRPLSDKGAAEWCFSAARQAGSPAS